MRYTSCIYDFLGVSFIYTEPTGKRELKLLKRYIFDMFSFYFCCISTILYSMVYMVNVYLCAFSSLCDDLFPSFPTFRSDVLLPKTVVHKTQTNVFIHSFYFTKNIIYIQRNTRYIYIYSSIDEILQKFFIICKEVKQIS